MNFNEQEISEELFQKLNKSGLLILEHDSGFAQAYRARYTLKHSSTASIELNDFDGDREYKIVNFKENDLEFLYKIENNS
jgi:UDP-N-acetylmuramyl pentapeptide synthase